MTANTITKNNKITDLALTFDDLLILPRYSDMLPHQADVRTHLTRKIKLNIPLLSAAMDTVTEANMAIALARIGGIGVIHKNMTIEAQAEQVRRVKKFESYLVRNPLTISAEQTVSDLWRITKQHNISGLPVLDTNGDLTGIVTNRDVRFISDGKVRIATIMTPKKRLITARADDSRETITALLQKHRIEKILIVDKDGALEGLITATDLRSTENEPNSCKDDLGQLRVAAAIGTDQTSTERASALIAAGVDLLVVDTAHGHSKGVINQVNTIKKQHDVAVIAGNIATEQAALALADAGADAVKVGIGPGSICTTRIVSGVGVPQLSAIMEVAHALKNHSVAVIADGGIRYSGDIAKALVAGAHSVMIGNLFAGTKEAPGELELYQGRSYKSYRGMGSIGAMMQKHGSSDRYFQDMVDDTAKLVPEGIEGRVPYRGLLANIVTQMIGGVRAAMGYAGCRTIEELHTYAQFAQISSASMQESHAHDIAIVKEAPNYSR